MTTPNDIYALQPESHAALNILTGCYYDFIPETGLQSWDLHDMASPRVDIRVLKEFYFDHRRFWRLATVWFDGKPVMIIQNAGREGDDHAERFITDADVYMEMIAHLKSITPAKMESEDKIVAPDQVNEKLTFFYGNALDGYFERF
jgi:hypothetical protein